MRYLQSKSSLGAPLGGYVSFYFSPFAAFVGENLEVSYLD